MRLENEEQRMKMDELAKKKQQTTYTNVPSSSYHPPSTSAADQGELRRLRQDAADKDGKIKELSSVVQQLQSKLQEKVNELAQVQSSKNIYESHNISKEEIKTAPELEKEEKKVPEVRKVPKVELTQVKNLPLELKLKLQSKGFAFSEMKDFFFKPYQGDLKVNINYLKGIFERNGIDDQKSLLLARYLVEPQN